MSSRDELTSRIAEGMQRVIAQSVLTNERIARGIGLNVVDTQTLGIINSSPTPMTAGEVSAATELPTSTTTRVLDRLEEKGLIARSPDPDDRRKVVITAQPKIYEVMGEAYGKILAELVELHESFTVAELEVVARYLEGSAGIGRG
jgi:DNA-binding MarR family transcriptional regulator